LFTLTDTGSIFDHLQEINKMVDAPFAQALTLGQSLEITSTTGQTSNFCLAISDPDQMFIFEVNVPY
jgi:hypothetical protein